MNKSFTIVVGIAVLLGLAIYFMTYSVPYNQVAVVTTFAKVDRDRPERNVVQEPGIRFKLPPPFQSVRKIDQRLQLVDTRLDTRATRDQLQVIVQAFLLWKVDDSSAGGVVNFYESYRGDTDAASADLEQRLRTAMAALSSFDFEDLVGPNNRLEAVEQAILDQLNVGDGASRGLASLGIQPVSVGLSQVLLPAETARTVVQRMQQERRVLAEIERSKGEAEFQRIRSDATQKSQRIRQYAETLANRIRVEGDRRATAAIAGLSEEPDLAIFLIWLDALEEIASRNSTFVMPTDMAPVHLLNIASAGSGVPKPVRSIQEFVAQGDPAAVGAANRFAMNNDELSVEGLVSRIDILQKQVEALLAANTELAARNSGPESDGE